MSNLLRLNILLLGSSGSGKSTIICKYQSRNFTPGKTIGVEVFSTTTVNKNNTSSPPACIRIYDMGGASYWWDWIPEYSKDAHFIFLFYDVTNAKTLDDAKEILKRLKPNKNNYRIILVGNKTDLVQQRVLKILDVNKWIGQRRLEGWQLRHIECSVKNITAFKTLLDKAIYGIKKIEIPLELRQTDFNINNLKKLSSWSDYFIPW